MLEDLLAWKELGIGAVSMIIFYVFAEAYRKDFFKQLDDANRRGEESQKRFMDFLESSYKENTKALSELVEGFKDHTRTKDEALALLEERYKN